MVFQIVQGASDVKEDDMLDAWHSGDVSHDDAVMYSGSTTGPSHDNSVCSPYVITWHVDKKCYRVSPEIFDAFCQQMDERYGLVDDLKPHGSRKLLSKKWVVEKQYVTPYE